MSREDSSCSSWTLFSQESNSKPAFVGTELQTDAPEPALKPSLSLLKAGLAFMATSSSFGLQFP